MENTFYFNSNANTLFNLNNGTKISVLTGTNDVFIFGVGGSQLLQRCNNLSEAKQFINKLAFILSATTLEYLNSVKSI